MLVGGLGELGIEFQLFEAEIELVPERLQIIIDDRILIHFEPVLDQNHDLFGFGVPFKTDDDRAIVTALRDRMGTQGTSAKKEKDPKQKCISKEHMV